MNVLLLGASGQLGTALQNTRPEGVNLIVCRRADIDLAACEDVERLVAANSVQLIVNAAAYTAVDKAESEEALAFRVNAQGVASVARAAQRMGARLVHVSTDYVFDGTKGAPYLPDDPTAPLGVYGRSKRQGELEALAGCANSLIVRTAWVYAEQGTNFVKTMLRLMADKPLLRVIADQIGSPTYATSLAQALWGLARTDSRGILHYTDSGVASWYDFACAIQDEALAVGLLKKAVPILPIPTSEYPTPAKRPLFSILDKSQSWALLGQPANHWRTNLRTMLEQLKNA
jgi:dTDP-4-dehydrorhamnose reductase